MIASLTQCPKGPTSVSSLPLIESAHPEHKQSHKRQNKKEQLHVESLNEKTKEWRNVVDYSPKQASNVMQAASS